MRSKNDRAAINPSALPTMSGVVYESLRKDIISGAFAPGDKLRIDQLCDKYDATSTPVREALNQLAMEGFVKRKDQRGFFVSILTLKELDELTNTRCWVESLALRQSIAHRTIAWEERLVLAFHHFSRMERSISADKFQENPEWEKSHKAFHMELLSACPSHWLLDFCALLFDHAMRYRNISMSVVYPKRDINAEHKQIFDLVISGDEEGAVAALVQHYRTTAEILHNKP